MSGRSPSPFLVVLVVATLPLPGAEPGGTRAAAATFHEDVEPVLQARCQGCHHEGTAAPFPLVSYRDVARRAGMLEWVLSERIMPPWFADAGAHRLANDLSMPDAERELVLEWLRNGTPQGDPSAAPEPIEWVEGWTIREPDATFAIPDPVQVPAEGVVDYVYRFVQTDFREDRWIQEVEIRSSAAEVVHHVLVGIAGPRREDGRRRLGLGARTYFASDVPGQIGMRFPPGLGKRLPAGAELAFQLHYTPNGKPATDVTEIGFVFADEPPPVELRTSAAVNWEFAIPPGAADVPVEAGFEFPSAARIFSLLPHTHLRGTGFRYELRYPDGRVEELLDVPRYDFNWQFNYVFAEPVDVPTGTILRAIGWYDNSAANPANPDPSAEVRWGEQTFEEMMIGYVSWYPTEEADGDR